MLNRLKPWVPRSPMLRHFLYAAFYRSGGFAALRRRNHAAGRRLTVVTFHRVADREAGDSFSLPTLFISPGRFAQVVRFLADRYRIVDLNRVLSGLEGRGDLPANSLLITFDDGYRDVFEHAVPILRREKIPALVFLTTAHLDRGERLFWWDEGFRLLSTACAEPDRLRRAARHGGDPQLEARFEEVSRLPSETARRDQVVSLIHAMQTVPETVRGKLLVSLGQGRDDDRRPLLESNAMVDWAEARRALQDGIEYGSHTCTHRFLDLASPETIRHELGQSRSDIERELGHLPDAFAYPGGKFGREVPGWVAEAGYRCAFTARRGINAPTAPPMLLKRVNIWNGTVAGRRGGFSAARLAFNLVASA